MEQLQEGWSAVTAEDGRVYYWNENTDETSWEKPVRTTGSGVASGYVAALQRQSSGGSGSGSDTHTEHAHHGTVSSLTKSFGEQALPHMPCMHTAPAHAHILFPPPPDKGLALPDEKSPASAPERRRSTSPSSPDSRSPALGVDALRKYREAKAKEHEKSPKLEATDSDKKRPPKVNIYE